MKAAERDRALRRLDAEIGRLSEAIRRSNDFERRTSVANEPLASGIFTAARLAGPFGHVGERFDPIVLT